MIEEHRRLRMYTFMRVHGLSLFEASDRLRDIGRLIYQHQI